MTEDSAIRIDLTLQSLYTLPTHGASPMPKTPGTRPTGTLELAPARSELDISNETDIPCAPLPSHRHTCTSHALGSPVSSRHDHRMAPTIAWPKTCPKRGRVPKTKLAIRTTAVFPAKATAARSPPTLVTTRKGSPSVYRIKACPYRQLWLYGKSSVRWHLVNV